MSIKIIHYDPTQLPEGKGEQVMLAGPLQGARPAPPPTASGEDHGHTQKQCQVASLAASASQIFRPADSHKQRLPKQIGILTNTLPLWNTMCWCL